MSPGVLVIGLDGATFDVLQPLAERGWLPNIARLMAEGVSSPLRSTLHPITPQAWSTFLTGKNAGKHGIYDFMVHKPGTYDIEFVNASFRKTNSFLGYLSQHQRPVGAVAVPFSFPPEPLNAFMLSGFDAPAEDERAVYPPALLEEIRRAVGDYFIHKASPVGRVRDDDKWYADVLVEDKNRTDVSLFLLDRYPCDVFVVVYNNIDRGQHQYLSQDYLDRLQAGDPNIREHVLTRVYENTDREVGRLLAARSDSDLVLLMSDHGAGPIRSVFRLNRWLEAHGFLQYASPSGWLPVVEGARFLAKRFLPRWVKGRMKSALSDVRDRVESFRYFSSIDWARTKAYGFGMYGNVYINLAGRQPQGTVAPSEYEGVLQEISDALLALRDPASGERVLERVYRREELYEGPHAEDAPDLILGWRDYGFYTSTSPGRETGDWFADCGRIDSSGFDHVGTHRLDGILIAAGRAVEKGTLAKQPHIADVAPTLLFAAGEAVPYDMEGHVLTELFTESFCSTRKSDRVHWDGGHGAGLVNYSEGEAREVQERLKNLGYL